MTKMTSITWSLSKFVGNKAIMYRFREKMMLTFVTSAMVKWNLR